MLFISAGAPEARHPLPTFHSPASYTKRWVFWQAKVNEELLEDAERERSLYQLEYVELSNTGEAGSATGLVGGLLRVLPNSDLPSHFHPEPFGEIYHFTRGTGTVVLNEHLDGLQRPDGSPDGVETIIDIVPGLHVNIPARTLHGIRAGSEGCEFLWTFNTGYHNVVDCGSADVAAEICSVRATRDALPADDAADSLPRWSKIPYLYPDPRYFVGGHLNLPADVVDSLVPFPSQLPQGVSGWDELMNKTRTGRKNRFGAHTSTARGHRN